MKKLLVGLALLSTVSAFAGECNLEINDYFVSRGQGSELRASVEEKLEMLGYTIVKNNPDYTIEIETFDSSPDLGSAKVYSSFGIRNLNGDLIKGLQIHDSAIVLFNKPVNKIKSLTEDMLKLVPTCEKLKKLENL